MTWYAVSEDGGSSVRITSGLRIGETPAGALALNDPEGDLQWLEFRLDAAGRPTLRVLDPAWTLVDADGNLQDEQPLRTGDVVMLPGNSLRVSRSIEAPPGRGRRIQVVDRRSATTAALAAQADLARDRDAGIDTPVDVAGSQFDDAVSGEAPPEDDSDSTLFAPADRLPRAPEPAPWTLPAQAPPLLDDSVEVGPIGEARPAAQGPADQSPAPRESLSAALSPERPLPEAPAPRPAIARSSRTVDDDELTVLAGSLNPATADDSLGDAAGDPFADVDPLDDPTVPMRRPRTPTRPDIWTSRGNAAGAGRGRRAEPGNRLVTFSRVAIALALLVPLALALLMNWDGRGAALDALTSRIPLPGRGAAVEPASEPAAPAPSVTRAPQAEDRPSTIDSGVDDSRAATAGGPQTPAPALAPGRSATAHDPAGDSAGREPSVAQSPAEQPAAQGAPSTPSSGAATSAATTASPRPAAAPKTSAPQTSAPKTAAPQTAATPAAVDARDSSASPASGAATASSASGAADPRITADLNRARQLLEEGDITYPPQRNAVSVLLDLLARHPGQPAAMAMLGDCTERLIDTAMDARARGLDFEARNTLEEVFGFNPDNARARALWLEWTGAPR